jgi:large subunit ribosomal protein L6
MSRIGKKPVEINKDATVNIQASEIVGHTKVTVEGPKGTLSRSFPNMVHLAVEGNKVIVTRNNNDSKSRAMHGTARALIANMVRGVTEGYSKKLLIEGTGYRAMAQGKNLSLNMGFSHPVLIEPPAGISFEVPKGNKQIIITGSDKEVVGEIAAKIRSIRPPEPYKGKGIRYSDEKIRRKAGKAGKAK